MSPRPHRAFASLLASGALLGGCTDDGFEPPSPDVTDGGVSVPDASPGPRYRVLHALAGDELASWTAVEARLPAFLDRWASVGGQVDSTLRIVIEPDPTRPRAEALRSLYGGDVSARLANARARIAGSASVTELQRIARSIHCDLPPLLSDVSFARIPDPPPPLDEVKETVTAQLLAVEDPAQPLVDFPTNNAWAVVLPDACSVVALGRSEDTSVRGHAFLQPDIVMHELGHIIHDQAWRTIPIVQRSRSLNEALADMFAHLYLDDPCHNHLPAPDPETGEPCRRYMDRHDRPVFESVLGDPRGSHEVGQGLRHLLWDARGPSAFAGLMAGVEAVAGALTPAPLPEPFDVVQDDQFLASSWWLRVSTTAFTAFVDAACRANPSTSCGQRGTYLGSPIAPDLLAQLERNAPSRIGATGREITLDGVPARLTFARGEDGIEVDVERAGQHERWFATGATYEYEPTYRISIVFEAEGAMRTFEWRSDGTAAYVIQPPSPLARGATFHPDGQCLAGAPRVWPRRARLKSR